MVQKKQNRQQDSTLKSWKGFLPPRAVVMAKKVATRRTATVQEASIIETSTIVNTAIVNTTQSPRLVQMASELKNCKLCKLCSGRKQIVFGEGNHSAELVFVGEGPGEQEDLQGRPFIGRAGQLLDRMILAMGLRREQVYIANVVKCRPPQNRNPEPDEIEACSPFLYKQLELIRPKVVVALGKFAAQTLLQTEERISLLRGRVHPFPKINAKLIPTFHPSYLLRNPDAKREAWIDLQLASKEITIVKP